MTTPPIELLDESSCCWHESNVPLQERGVRMSWLVKLVDSIYEHTNWPLWQDYTRRLEQAERAESQRKAALWNDNIPEPEWVDTREPELLELTTRQFVAQHVIPFTALLKIPLYARIPESERGKPSVFLSHAWDAIVLAKGKGRWGRYGTLDAFGPGVAGIQDEFVWIDFVCYNQHTVAEESIAFDMESIVKSIGKVAFAVTPVSLFDRIWCLWEVLSVARNPGVDSQFCAAPGYQTDKRLMVNAFFEAFTSVTSAGSTKREDKDKILGAMNSYFGSTDAADDYIRHLIKRGMSHPWFGLH